MFKNNRGSILGIAILTLATIIIFFVPEFYFSDKSLTLCIHRRILGLKCPLCGMTSAVHAFIHLNFIEAIRSNLTVIFLPVVFCIEILRIFTDIRLELIRKIVYYSFGLCLVLLYAFRIAEYLKLN